jgi:hypothetical protein
VGGSIGYRPWRTVVPLLLVDCSLLLDAAVEPGGGDGDVCHWLMFGRQLGQRVGLLISGDAGVSGYPVYHYLYYVGSEGECCIADQGSYFLPGAMVETCRPGNGGLIVRKDVDVMPALQNYGIECCQSQSDGIIDGFSSGCSKHRGESPWPCVCAA